MDQFVVYGKLNRHLPFLIPQGYTIMNRTWGEQISHTQIDFSFFFLSVGQISTKWPCSEAANCISELSSLLSTYVIFPSGVLWCRNPASLVPLMTNCAEHVEAGGQRVPPHPGYLQWEASSLWQTIISFASFFHQISLVIKTLRRDMALVC